MCAGARIMREGRRWIALDSIAGCVGRWRKGLVGVGKRGMALVYGLFAR